MAHGVVMPWLQPARTFERCGDAEGAAPAAPQGAARVREVAAAQAPAEFRPSFIDRQPVDRELLARTARKGYLPPSGLQ